MKPTDASLQRGSKLRIPPIIIAILAAGLMWAAARLALPFRFAIPGRGFLAALFLMSGAAIALLGVLAFRRAKTTVNPIKLECVSRLVVSGIYRVTRNPMYLGFLVMLIGVAIWSANALAFLALPGFILVMNRLQIEPEERTLRARFGDQYALYEKRVRRWL